MLTGPFRPCPRPGCRHLVDLPSVPCPDHGDELRNRRLQRDRERAPRTAVVYGQDWRRLRRVILAERPACEVCGAREQLEVHHRISVRERPDLRLERSNLVVLCIRCHARLPAAVR